MCWRTDTIQECEAGCTYGTCTAPDSQPIALSLKALLPNVSPRLVHNSACFVGYSGSTWGHICALADFMMVAAVVGRNRERQSNASGWRRSSEQRTKAVTRVHLEDMMFDFGC